MFWYEGSFCKHSCDSPGDEAWVYLITDPRAGEEYWRGEGRFPDMVRWVEDGFPGVFWSDSPPAVWILSPDPGKEV